MSRRHGLGLIACLATIVLVNLGVAHLTRSDDSALGDRQRDALRSAQVRVPTMLTFSHENLDGDLAVASGNATGAFRQEYAERLQDFIDATWEERGASMRSSVRSVGYTGMHEDDVGVLVVLDSELASEQDAPVRQTLRLAVTMRSAGEQWLVSGLKML